MQHNCDWKGLWMRKELAYLIAPHPVYKEQKIVYNNFGTDQLIVLWQHIQILYRK